MSKTTLSRRQFLRLTAVGAAAALAACSPTPVPPQEPTKAAPAATQPPAATKAPAGTAAPVAKYKEAPMLADLVKGGKLPPVDQRLPPAPLVVKPQDAVGKYGGEWRTGTIERNGNDLLRNIGYEQLFRYSPDYKTVLMNCAEAVKASDDGKEYTITLRKGLKWSDGTPLTSDDVVFWYEDVIINKEVTPTPPKPLYVITKVDDLTFKWAWPSP